VREEAVIVATKDNVKPNDVVALNDEYFRVMEESELPVGWVTRAIKNTKTLIALESFTQKDILVVVCSRVRVLNPLEAIVAVAG
jgi:hypothetical protein